MSKKKKENPKLTKACTTILINALRYQNFLFLDFENYSNQNQLLLHLIQKVYANTICECLKCIRSKKKVKSLFFNLTNSITIEEHIYEILVVEDNYREIRQELENFLKDSIEIISLDQDLTITIVIELELRLTLF